jgi:hypothetical protein
VLGQQKESFLSQQSRWDEQPRLSSRRQFLGSCTRLAAGGPKVPRIRSSSTRSNSGAKRDLGVFLTATGVYGRIGMLRGIRIPIG